MNETIEELLDCIADSVCLACDEETSSQDAESATREAHDLRGRVLARFVALVRDKASLQISNDARGISLRNCESNEAYLATEVGESHKRIAALTAQRDAALGFLEPVGQSLALEDVADVGLAHTETLANAPQAHTCPSEANHLSEVID